MLVTEEYKCPYCGGKAIAFSGGFRYQPATHARCIVCKKEFPINEGIGDKLKKIIKGK